MHVYTRSKCWSRTPRLLMATMSALATRGVSSSTITATAAARCSSKPRIGVVGAGISGLLFAERLRELVPDSELTVFEWGRGPGGRTARRRLRLEDSESQLSFDHAAPYFTAVTPRFREKLSRLQEARLCSPWAAAGQDAWVGVPSNHAIARALAADLEAGGARMRFGHHVLSARPVSGGGWTVNSSCRATGEAVEDVFDALVLSDKLLVLPNKYAVLAEADHGPLALPRDLESTGAVVLLLALRKTPGSEGAVGGVRRLTAADHEFLRLIVEDSSKPGRVSEHDLYVVHSSHDYSRQHLVGEALDDEAAVRDEMVAAALAALGRAGDATQVAHASVMAWDHAQPKPKSRVDAPFLIDTERAAGVVGDFFTATDGREGVLVEGVEAAALSGLSLADAMAPLFRAEATAATLRAHVTGK